VKFQPGSSSMTPIIVHTMVCSWAQCIVLDSAEFLYTNPWTGDEQQPFVVLAAFGYAADGSALPMPRPK